MNMTRQDFEFVYHYIRTKIDPDIEEVYRAYILGQVPYWLIWQNMRETLISLDLGRGRDAKRIYELFNI